MTLCTLGTTKCGQPGAKPIGFGGKRVRVFNESKSRFTTISMITSTVTESDLKFLVVTGYFNPGEILDSMTAGMVF
uniref:Uncharacterized protein n=1 Tax=Steinernema glaseri TaxID=37863 RepID=A0A1I7ZYA3_9BILA